MSAYQSEKIGASPNLEKLKKLQKHKERPYTQAPPAKSGDL